MALQVEVGHGSDASPNADKERSTYVAGATYHASISGGCQGALKIPVFLRSFDFMRFSDKQRSSNHVRV